MTCLRSLPLLLLAGLPLCSIAADNDSAPRPFVVRTLVNLDRVSSPILSPDGHHIVFALRQTDYAANKGFSSLWIEDAAEGNLAPRRLLANGMGGNSPAFYPNGNDVYFISSKSGIDQVWRQPIAGGAAVQVTHYPVDVNNFKLSA